MKTDTTSSVSLFLVAGAYKDFNENQRVDFFTTPDGEYHTYTVYLDNGVIDDYTDYITRMRLDFTGDEEMEVYELDAF